MTIHQKHSTSIVESQASAYREAETLQSMPAVLWIGSTISLIIFAMIFYALVRILGIIGDIWKSHEEHAPETPPILSSRASSSTSCRHCHFFNSSFYLNCAVHPKKVLTQQAIDCSDYSLRPPKDEGF
jgi:hypothetical protein